MLKNTSWGNVADWYSGHLSGGDTYHEKVLLPNVLRLLQNTKGMRVLEIGCGNGFFARAIAKEGAEVDASDISPELIANAKDHKEKVRCFVSSAEKLSFAKDGTYDVVLAVLSLQNMERLDAVSREVRRVIKPEGRFLCVLNHPTFRIPKHSSWGWDEELKTQFRRVDAYMTPHKVEIDMHPGKREKKQTYSFHRSLQDHFKALAKAGFAVTRLEEWISHKKSGKGPRQAAEDRARKEFPLFLAIEARVFPEV